MWKRGGSRHTCLLRAVPLPKRARGCRVMSTCKRREQVLNFLALPVQSTNTGAEGAAAHDSAANEFVLAGVIICTLVPVNQVN